MIITKTPLRISFFGGGSDIQCFFKSYQGTVLSSTINKYVYLAFNTSEVKHIKLIYSKIEIVDQIKDLEHDRAREALLKYNLNTFNKGLEIGSFSDIVTNGSGLGSSSTYTVGLIKAITGFLKHDLTKYELAESACDIEINRCNQPIGKQDQYAASFGGFNVFSFYENQVTAIPLNIPYTTIKTLENRLLLINTGQTRLTESVLSKQLANLSNNQFIEYTKQLSQHAIDGINFFLNDDLDSIGKLLHHSWLIKKKMASNISNNNIDYLYDIGLDLGALGGKLLGAGGGGYLMFYFPDAVVKNFAKNHFKSLGFDNLDFEFESNGCTVEMNDGYR